MTVDHAHPPTEQFEQHRAHRRGVAYRMLGGRPRRYGNWPAARTWAQGAVAFSRMAPFIQPALVDGSVGLVLAPEGRLSRALRFTIADRRIVAVDVVADPERLRALTLAVLE